LIKTGSLLSPFYLGILFSVPAFVIHFAQERAVSGLRYDNVIMRLVFLAIATGLALAGAASADENVRAVQNKLHDDGFYSGQIDGAYSSELSAALTRYQIRHGLPITGQLDEDTSKELDAKPAVTNSSTGGEQSSETWHRLRRGQQRPSTSARQSETAAADARETSSPRNEEPAETNTGTPSEESTQDTSSNSSEMARSPLASPATALATGSPAPEFSTERLRDYVAAFVLAGLDRNVGAESDFFADRVEYYDQGTMDREKVRDDLKRYDERWPERHFWVAGTINIEPQSDNRVRVTFPLGFKLRNGNKTLNGKVSKTLLLEPAGSDFQIVAVNERKSE